MILNGTAFIARQAKDIVLIDINTAKPGNPPSPLLQRGRHSFFKTIPPSPLLQRGSSKITIY